jgi:glycosyltransferase involved in cell wall biosynthesis
MVSIIIPNYNHSKFLTQRIESVLHQTYEDFELILLDDASSDESSLVIEKFRGHPKISHIVFNETNSGSTFLQWKKGVSLAKGEYIWIAESDDYCEPEFLEECQSIFERNSGVGIVYVGTTAVDVNEIPMWTSPSSSTIEIWEGKLFINEKMIFGNAIFNASMAVFKRSLLEDFFPKVDTYKFCGDWLFWISISKNTKVARSPKMLNYFRNHSGDVSGRSFKDGTYFFEYKSMLRELLDLSLVSAYTFNFALYKMLASIDLYNLSEDLRNKVKREYLNEFTLIDMLICFLELNLFQRFKMRIKLLKAA